VTIEEGDSPDIVARFEVTQVGERHTKEKKDEIMRRLVDMRTTGESVARVRLRVPPVAHKLAIAVTPERTELEPGESTTIDVSVADALGKPVAGAEVAVLAVDEAVLAVGDKERPDPLSAMYGRRESTLLTASTSQNVLLAQDFGDGLFNLECDYGPMASMARMSGDPGGPAGPPPLMRADFKPYAVWAPAVTTDASGHVRVPVTLPGSLTRYRIWAVAAAGLGDFGAGEGSLVARRSLMVRPSPPRFLRVHDSAQISALVENRSDLPLTVDVAARSTGLDLGRRGQRVQVPPHDRVEVSFPAQSQVTGQAQIQFIARAGKVTDAAAVTLPVWLASVPETTATYGDFDSGGVALPVEVSGHFVPEFGGLSVSTSSTALSQLTDAALYLTGYPYECSEQLASRLLAIAALHDLLPAMHPEGMPDDASIRAAVQRDLNQLAARRDPNSGGYAYWPSGAADAFLTLHVVHALVRLRQAGYEVAPRDIDAGLAYARQGDRSRWSDSNRQGSDPGAAAVLAAFGGYVANLANPSGAGFGGASYNPREAANIPAEALGWMLATSKDERLRGAIEQGLLNTMEESAGQAVTRRGSYIAPWSRLEATRRADAAALIGMLAADPENPATAKLARGLLGDRVRGRWANTHETAYALTALADYFRKREVISPHFTADVWVGDTAVGEHKFDGRSTEQALTFVPMSALTGDLSVTIGLAGQGRLYYRAALDSAEVPEMIKAENHGFSIRRVYEGVDSAKDVRHDSDGWHVRAGARVRINVGIETTQERSMVAVVDELPAGFEAINPDLRGVQPLDVYGRAVPRGRDEQSFWAEYQNLRAERAEAFATRLPEGTYLYSYLARATTPGRFTAPPSRAEEMYAPETSGHGATERVIVE
jgi:hypothetical protein